MGFFFVNKNNGKKIREKKVEVDESVELKTLKLLIKYAQDCEEDIDGLICELGTMPENEKILDFKTKIGPNLNIINFNLSKIKNAKSIVMRFTSGSTVLKREVNEIFEGFVFMIHPVESKKVLLRLLENQEEKINIVLKKLMLSLERVLKEEEMGVEKKVA